MEPSGRWQGRLLVVAEILLAGALTLAPLAFGTVQLKWLLPLFALVAGAAVAAALARPLIAPWPLLAAVAVCTITGLQIVPLPRALLGVLSPHALELLERSLGSIGHHAVSLDTPATARELARLCALALAMFVASRLAADWRAARRLALAVGGLTILECTIIVAHKVVATNAIYGVVTTTQYNLVLGSFGNANFLAAYLTLGVPLLCALALDARERGDRIAWLITAVAAALMVVLTGSRSGLGGLLAALLALGWATRHRLAEHRRALLAIGGAATVLAVVALVTEPVRLDKLRSLLHPGTLGGELKLRAWRDVPALIHDYWLTGIGRGAFETVFPGYKHVPVMLTFTHVENAPLQILADYGLLTGAGVMVAWLGAIALGFRRELVAPRDDSALRLAAAAALLGITVHELGDFSLDMSGAVGLTTAVLFGLLWPARRPSRREAPGEPGPVWLRVPPHSHRVQLGAAAAVLAVGSAALWMAVRGDIARDLRLVKEAATNPDAEIEPLVREAMARHPGEPWFAFIAGVDRVRHRRPEAALGYLNRALLLDPTAWRPHQVLGEAMRQLGHSGQAMIEFRMAYIGSEFADSVAGPMVSHPDLSIDAILDGFAASNQAALAAFAGYLERSSRLDAAASAGARLLALQPNDVAAHRLMARVELRRRNFEAVLEHCRALPPGDTEGLLGQVQALDGLGRAADADELLSVAEKAAAAAPLAAGTAMMLAERALQRRHAGAALGALDRIVQDGLDPQSIARIHMLRSRAFEVQGQMRDAIMESEHAARLDPCEATWFAMASLYERVGLLREALLVYRGAVRSSPHPSDELRARLARAEGAFGAPSITGAGAPVGGAALDDELAGGGGAGAAADEEPDDTKE